MQHNQQVLSAKLPLKLESYVPQLGSQERRYRLSFPNRLRPAGAIIKSALKIIKGVGSGKNRTFIRISPLLTCRPGCRAGPWPKAQGPRPIAWGLGLGPLDLGPDSWQTLRFAPRPVGHAAPAAARAKARERAFLRWHINLKLAAP